MTDRAHIQLNKSQWELVRTYDGEKGKVRLSDRSIISPVVIGYDSGNDKVVPFSEVVEDTSTGTVNKVVTSSVEVTETAVTKTTTVRDKTQKELDQEEADNETEASTRLDDERVFRRIMRAMYRVANGNVPVPARQSPADFVQWVKGLDVK